MKLNLLNIILCTLIFSNVTNVKTIYSRNLLDTKEVVEKNENNNIERYNTLTDKQKLEDIDYLYNMLKENQPHFNQKLFLNEIKTVKENISDYNDLEFNYELARIIACAKDAHTKIYISSQESLSYPIIPIWKVEEYNGWYIKGISSEYKNYAGKELLAINGHSIDEILKLIEPYVSTENKINVKNSLTELIQNAEFLKYIGIIKDTDTIPITLRNSNGTVKFVKINTVMSDDEETFKSGSWISAPKTQDSNEIYRFFPIDDSTLFIQCNKCFEDKNNPLENFHKELIKEISTGKYKKVIFDLRYNTGGNYPSFQYLTDIPIQLKDKYNYELYALIGTTTFSSGVIQAVQLKEGGAILAGSPTGGNVNFYANNKMFELPNSHIKGYYSTAYMDISPDYKGDCLIPDIYVERTIQDILKGIDSDIYTIMNNNQ